MTGLVPRALRPEPAAFAEIAKQVAPTSFAFLVMILAGFIIQYALKGFGEHAVAGYGIAIRLEQILLLPVLGVTNALLPIVAQNYGAGHYARVRKAVRVCVTVGLAMTALAFPVLWLAGRAVLGLFTDDPEVIRVGVEDLRVESFLLPIYMMHFAFTSFLQALKRPIWTLWISLYRQALGTAVFVWLFVGWLGFDELGVWLGVAAAVSTGLVMALAIASSVAAERMGGPGRPQAAAA